MYDRVMAVAAEDCAVAADVGAVVVVGVVAGEVVAPSAGNEEAAARGVSLHDGDVFRTYDASAEDASTQADAAAVAGVAVVAAGAVDATRSAENGANVEAGISAQAAVAAGAKTGGTKGPEAGAHVAHTPYD